MWLSKRFLVAASGTPQHPDPTQGKVLCWTHTHSVDTSLFIQSALLAALEIFVGGNALLRDTSTLMSCVAMSRCMPLSLFYFHNMQNL